MSPSGADSGLALIIGKRLDAVCFVLDYVTFQFHDHVLAALSDPLVIQSGEVLTSGRPGYRDALCSLIERVVVSVSETAEKLGIELDRDIKIVVDLNAASPPGPEMATLSDKGRFITAWLRPGTAFAKQVLRKD